jgi:hypothetical protein
MKISLEILITNGFENVKTVKTTDKITSVVFSYNSKKMIATNNSKKVHPFTGFEWDIREIIDANTMSCADKLTVIQLKESCQSVEPQASSVGKSAYENITTINSTVKNIAIVLLVGLHRIQ